VEKKKHCRASLLIGIQKMFFLPFHGVLALHVEFIELISRIRMD
jgi:hypothetical protein